MTVSVSIFELKRTYNKCVFFFFFFVCGNRVCYGISRNRKNAELIEIFAVYVWCTTLLISVVECWPIRIEIIGESFLYANIYQIEYDRCAGNKKRWECEHTQHHHRSRVAPGRTTRKMIGSWGRRYLRLLQTYTLPTQIGTAGNQAPSYTSAM
jgi:hypothetical protein